MLKSLEKELIDGFCYEEAEEYDLLYPSSGLLPKTIQAISDAEVKLGPPNTDVEHFVAYKDYDTHGGPTLSTWKFLDTWARTDRYRLVRDLSRGRSFSDRGIYRRMVESFAKEQIPIRLWPYLITVSERENFGRKAHKSQNEFNIVSSNIISIRKWGSKYPGVLRWLDKAGLLDSLDTKHWESDVKFIVGKSLSNTGLAAKLLLVHNSRMLALALTPQWTRDACENLNRLERATLAYLSVTGIRISAKNSAGNAIWFPKKNRYSNVIWRRIKVVVSGYLTARQYLRYLKGGKRGKINVISIVEDPQARQYLRQNPSIHAKVKAYQRGPLARAIRSQIRRFQSRYKKIFKYIYKNDPI